jgi:hypothetical protein
MKSLPEFTIPQAPLWRCQRVSFVIHLLANLQASVEECVANTIKLVTLGNSSRGTLSKSMVLSPVQLRMAGESRSSDGSKA